MRWEPRTLHGLRAAQPYHHPNIEGDMVDVNYEEAILLLAAGATVRSSGCIDLERGCQSYSFEGTVYYWLAGYGSGSCRDEYPSIDAVDSRIRTAMAAGRGAEWA